MAARGYGFYLLVLRITTEFVGFIPQSLVLRPLLILLLIYRYQNWSIGENKQDLNAKNESLKFQNN